MRNKLFFGSLAVLLLLAVLSGCDETPTDPTGTPCEGHPHDSPDHDSDCQGNVGCKQMAVQCGRCACTMCLDEACLQATCDDGGIGCGGSP